MNDIQINEVWRCPRCGAVRHDPPDEQAWAHYGQRTGVRTCGYKGEWTPYVPEASTQRYRAALERIANELGVPGPDYPAPVANAAEIARAALSEEGE